MTSNEQDFKILLPRVLKALKNNFFKQILENLANLVQILKVILKQLSKVTPRATIFYGPFYRFLPISFFIIVSRISKQILILQLLVEKESLTDLCHKLNFEKRF